jgi:hypothetical protein
MHGSYAGHEDLFDDGFLSVPRLAFHPQGYRSRVNDFEKFEGTFARILHENRLKDRARAGESPYGTNPGIPDITSTPARDADHVISGHTMVMPTPFGDLTVHTITTLVTAPAPGFGTYIPDFRVHMLVPDGDTNRGIMEEISSHATKENIPEALWPAVVWP